jgi:hypothetical protein
LQGINYRERSTKSYEPTRMSPVPFRVIFADGVPPPRNETR